MSRPDEISDIQALIKDLEARLADLEARLPAHSIPPQFISEMDDLDEQIQVMKTRLAALLSAVETSENQQAEE